jgi:nucleotide sugar dehydrogenase
LITTAGDGGYEPRLLRAVVEVNHRQRRVVVAKLRRHLKTLPGKRVCLLGLAFKPGTDDLRDAPAVEVARLLIAAGAAVRAHDPVVSFITEVPEVSVVPSAYDAARGADAAVVMTEWPDYLGLDPALLRAAMRGRLLIDGRNIFDPMTMVEQGFVYEGIGRSIPQLMHHGYADGADFARESFDGQVEASQGAAFAWSGNGDP